MPGITLAVVLGNIAGYVTQHNVPYSKLSRYLYCKDGSNFDRVYFKDFFSVDTLITCVQLIAFERNVRDVFLGDKNMTCTYHMRTIDISYL